MIENKYIKLKMSCPINLGKKESLFFIIRVRGFFCHKCLQEIV